KQINGLFSILKCDCGLTDRQRIVCQRGQNDVATDFLRGTQDNTTSLSNNTFRKCGFIFWLKKRPPSDISGRFYLFETLFVWNFICLELCLLERYSCGILFVGILLCGIFFLELSLFGQRLYFSGQIGRQAERLDASSRAGTREGFKIF